MTFQDISPFSGFLFWAITFLFIVLHRSITTYFNHPMVRNIGMIITSFIIVGSIIGIQLFILLIVISVINFYSGYFLLNGSSEQNKKKILFIAIILITFLLCFFKYSLFQNSVKFLLDFIASSFKGANESNKHIFFIGISYFCFKFIHFQIECYKKKIKHLNLITFINYTIFFPSFFSGPINRYEVFAEDIQYDDNGNKVKNIIHGIKRIITGLFKKIVLANNLFPYTVAVMNFNDPTVDANQAIIGIYAYMFFIYFDFSGYTDMAIGVGRLLGIKLPENFNAPFLKRNLQQFWANWHMSLTNWLTEYIYWPTVRKLRRIKRLKKLPVTISNICILLTFAVCGIWHGDGLNFFIWGLYHGIGLALLNIYISIEKKLFSIRLRKIINTSRIGYAASTLITLQYVAFGFFLFGCDITKQQQFVRLFY